jgi:hypothetical protein
VKKRSIKPRRLNGSKTSTFQRPATLKGVYKLYVMKDRGEFCYIGLAKRGMAQRMRTGCKPNTTTGYHGYQLKGLRDFDLHVCVLPVSKDKRFPEAVEAELAFLIRTKTGRWPTRQHEIHFHNDVPSAKALAKRLFRKLG